MTRYELLVKINDTTYYLDTFQYDPISLNYDIANIKDISGRNSAYSKTIKLPDSSHNREVLGYITNLSVDSTVDANKVIKANIMVDTISVFEGNLQLKKFQKNFKTGEFDIEVVVYADNDTFFTLLGEKYISDLDLSTYNHDWTANNIRRSWTGTVGFPYRYPLIDYGSNWNILDISGLTAAGGTLSTAFNTVTVDEMFPAISRKAIFDRIFQEAGFTYDSEFLNSDYFKNEYIPFNGVKLPGESRQGFEVGLSASIIATQGTPYTLHFNYLINDPDSLWNFPNSYYENDGDTISQRFSITMAANVNNYLGASNDQRYIELRFYKEYNNITQTTDPTWASGDGYLFSTRKIFNIYGVGEVGSWEYQENGVFTRFDIGGGGSFTFQTNVTSDFVNTIANDKVRIKVFLYQAVGSNSNLIMGNGRLAILKNEYNPYIEPGGLITFNTILPKKIKQRDFILSACKEYNLYIEPSKDYPNSLIIEPRDDYYANGAIKDWSSKLDLNQSIEIDILAETQNRITTFSHKEDKDYLNAFYKQSFNEIYGQYDFDSGNEFAKTNNKRIESIFSPTPLNLVPGSIGLIIPLITKDVNFSYNTSGAGKLETNIRTLQWGGLITINNDFDRFSFDGEFVFNDSSYAYPYMGHLDNPYNPTVDNNFGDPIDVFFPNNGLTTNNLFNRFWYKTMYELTNRNSRLVTASFYLTAEDIYNFRFSDRIYLEFDGNGQYYKVNKIVDFDPGTAKTCKVELLKTDEIRVNTFTPKFIGKGGKLSTIADKFRFIGSMSGGFLELGSNNDIGNNDGVLVVGQNNNVDGTSTFVNGDFNSIKEDTKYTITSGTSNKIGTASVNIYTYGDNNTIGTASQNIYTFGNNNTFADGVTSSFVIGDNTYVTQSNAVYISGNIIFSGTISGSFSFPGPVNPIGYYEGEISMPPDGEVDSFRNGDVGPYFKVISVDSGTSSQSWKSIIIDSGNNTGNIMGSADEPMSSSLIIGGLDNIIGPDTGDVDNTINNMSLNSSGSRFTLDSNTKFNSIISSSGVTMSTGVNHTTVIAMDNFTATESNTVYLPNVKFLGTVSGIGIGLKQVLDYNNIDDDTQFSIDPNNNIILGRTNSSVTGFGTDSIIFGNNNDIINSTGAFAGGFDNIINFSNATFVYGYQNTATNSFFSGVFGQLNQSTGNWNLISGQSNKAYFSTAGLISGIGNYITQSLYGVILGGIDNGIQNATSSVVIGGHNHLIDDVENSVIIGGSGVVATQSNTVYLPNLYITGDISVNGTQLDLGASFSIIGGTNNFIYGNSTASIIAGGDGNYVSASQYSVIVGGQNNYIELGQFDTILGSLESYIYDSEFSNIVASKQSYIIDSSASSIFGSELVNIDSCTQSSIISSYQFSGLTNSENSSVISTFNSKVSNSDSSCLIGGSGNNVFDSDTSFIASARQVTIQRQLPLGDGFNRTMYIIGGFNALYDGYCRNVMDLRPYINQYYNVIDGFFQNSQFCTLYDLTGFDMISCVSVSATMSASSDSSLNKCSFIEIQSVNNSLLNFVRSSLLYRVDFTSMFNCYNITANDVGYSLISNLYNSFIYGITASTILAPLNLSATASYNISILGSENLVVDGLTQSEVIGGTGNIFNSSQYSLMAGGNSNFLTQSIYSQMIGGISNSLYNSYNSIIIGGSGNTLQTSFQAGVIIGGVNNTIGPVYGGWSTIVGGDTNTITGFYANISGGVLNNIGLGTYSNGNYSFIGGGWGNAIYSTQSTPCRESGIVGGFQNLISTRWSFIGGGYQNNIKSQATQSCILGGKSNIIENGIERSVVLGGQNITALQNDTAYVPNLISKSDTPSSTVQSSAGTGATVSITGTNIAGSISITAGTGTGTGQILSATFSNSFSYPNGCSVVLFASNSLGASYGSLVYATGTTNAWSVFVSSPLSTGQTYTWNYQVIGY